MILIFGKDGQVGQELQRALSLAGKVKFLARKDCDLTDKIAVMSAIDHFNPEIIINAQAYTAVDKAESERDLAFAVNATAVGAMAGEAARINAHFIHYSTDYVYDGTKTGIYLDNEPHNPLNIYGASKSEGERLIANATDSYTILRCTWVYSLFGACFPRAILNKAKTSDLTVVNDQFGAPTSAAFIADVTALLTHKIIREGGEKYRGTYNLVLNGHTNWHEYAQMLVDEAGLSAKVEPISSAPALGKAVRPLNSRLSPAKLEAALGVTMPHWSDEVKRFVRDYMR
jgi:dTDP-4-dehydrorhamnose reductase